MSRWSKNNVVVPLDTLINKEKENTNRPIAARSCGTVGRWGKMGFTSTRTYALKALPPSSLSPAGQSPELGTTPTGAGQSITGNTTGGGSTTTGGCVVGDTSPISEAPVPKPKKFFKSRNTTAPLDLIRSQFMQHHMSHISYVSNPAETASITSHQINNHIQPREGAVVASGGGLKIKIKKRSVERKSSISSVEKLDKDKRKKEKDDKKKDKDDKKKEKDDKKKEGKILKPETQPSRILGRSRKPVNYNEDDDSIPYRNTSSSTNTTTVPTKKQQSSIETIMPENIDEEELLEKSTEELVPISIANTNTTTSSPQSSITHNNNNKSSSGMGSNSGVTTTTEHPPIVLRISKGTSRLISTDSEDQQNTSPGHQENCDFSPPAPPIKIQSNKIISSVLSTSVVTSNVTEISTTEELLSVLSGEPTTIEPTITHTNNNNNSPFIEQNNEINYGAKISPDKPPKERLKLIIKTDVLKKALAAERAEKAEKKKNKKHHHHHHHHHHSHKNITLKLTNLTDSSAIKFKTPSPQPGNDNYDLYKQLTISPSDRDFDSQSSILGSSSITSSKGTTTIGLSGSLPLAAIAVPEDSCVIRSRGSSDITSDLETSQHSSLVAPPSDIESRLESMMDNEDDVGGGRIIDNNITNIGDNSNIVIVNNEQNNCNNKKDNIRIKLKLLTEDETTIVGQQQPLQEDILEVLTGGVNEKEIIINKNKKPIKKNVTIKKDVEKKNIPTVSPTVRVTRATRRVAIVTDDSQTEVNEEENIVKEDNEQIEIEKPMIRSRRAANKKVPLIETPTEPIKEIQLIPVIPVKAKSKTAKTTIKQKSTTTTPEPIKEIINSSLELLPIVVGKRKRGQKIVISNTESTEESEQIAIIETLDSKESKIKETKQIKIKDIKPPSEIKPTSPAPAVRARRGAAVKANAALSTSSPTKSIDNSSKESTVTKKNSSPLPLKRGRGTRNNNLKTLNDSELSLENTENNNHSQSDEISGITYTIEKSKPIIVLTPIKSYGSRKRKSQQPQKEIQIIDKIDNESLITNESTKSIDLPGTITPVTTLNETTSSSLNLTPQTNKIDSSIDTVTPTSNTILSTTSSSQTTTTDENSSPPTKKEYKINKFKRAWYERDTKNNLENEKPHKLSNNNKIQSSEIITDDNTTTTGNDDGDDDNEPVIKKSTTTKDKLINNYDNSKLINKININKINNIVVNNMNTENNENGELMKSTTTLKTNNLTDQINDEQQNSTISTNNSVKLVISKKKGSIFKSRALIAEQGATTAGIEKKRHIYKHTWNAATKNPTEKMEFDDDDDDGENIKPIKNKLKNLQKNIGNNKEITQNSTVDSIFDDFNDDENDDDDDDDDDNEPLISHKLNRIQRTVNTQNSCGGSSSSGNCGKLFNDSTEQIIQTSVRCDKKAKEYYTVVRNVKAAHQIQEIGEYQEMDDDVEYILDALQPHNPISTRCLSALQLATKCMTPAFRMHVRAHGTVTKFFKALRDAKNDLSLGLCTAAIMFVLSQDTLNIDLDPDSLELMINLLEVDIVKDNNHPTSELTIFERNKIKVRELCEDIKSQGKGTHLNLDTITVGTLAMETLLSLTSKKAGDWFKEELRKLGGLEHIIKTICDCCHQISDYVVSWTEILLDKLRTIERCLRVLENVSQLNETNQKYILTYRKGHAINTLFKLYKLCDSEIALYPTTDLTPKDNPGVVLREALVPTLKVLINLTHPFNDKALGSSILGDRIGIFDTSFHILLQAPNYVPERCIFELSILVLLLLINLTMHTIPNRKLIMQSHAPSDFGNQFDKVPAIKALIEYFYRCEEQARMAEKNTDAILENPEKSKSQSQEEVDETVTKLLQKAGHHMEHTLQASYAGILIGHLISDNKDNEIVIRSYLKEKSFSDIVSVLEKYYNFMNLTASSEATVVSHIKSTKQIIDNFKQCDSHSNNTDTDDNNISSIATTSSSNTSTNNRQEPTPSTSVSTRSTPRVYKTYSQR